MADLIITNNSNTLIQGDTTIDPQESGIVLTSRDAIIDRIIEYYNTIPGASIIIKNCILTGENNGPIDVYTKDEVRDLLINYYTKEQLISILTQVSSITGNMFEFYLSGINLTEEIPNKTSQIAFNLINSTPLTKIFTIRLLNSFVINTGTLFNLWIYLNGLSLSTSYNVTTLLRTNSNQKISEGYFNLKPSTMYELFVVPMNTNFLANALTLIQEEVIYLEIIITKDTSFAETVSIVSGPDKLSRLTLNNNQLSANNVFDYKAGQTYSQSKLNNSLI